MDIAVFSAAELPLALGALRALALGGVASTGESEASGRDADQAAAARDRFLEVIARLHGAHLAAATLPSPTPAEVAAAIADAHRRKRLLQLAVVMSMIDGKVAAASARRVAALATALDVRDAATRTLRKLVAQRRNLTRLDLARRIGRRFIGDAWHDERWAGVRKLVLPLLFKRGEDAVVAWRYKQLGLMPAGSFGRVFWEHCTARQFGFPGEKGAIPERMVFHDLGHVLAGYDTDPAGEIQQAAFQSGFVRNDGFVFLFFGIVQFHLGVRITPVAAPEVGYFDVDKVLTALGRGAACAVDLSDRWDFWPLLGLPLDEVRQRLAIPAMA